MFQNWYQSIAIYEIWSFIYLFRDIFFIQLFVFLSFLIRVLFSLHSFFSFNQFFALFSKLIASNQKFEKNQKFDSKKSNQTWNFEFEICFDIKSNWIIEFEIWIWKYWKNHEWLSFYCSEFRYFVTYMQNVKHKRCANVKTLSFIDRSISMNSDCSICRAHLRKLYFNTFSQQSLVFSALYSNELSLI